MAEEAADPTAAETPEELLGFLEALPPELAEGLPPELFSDELSEVGTATEQMSGISYFLRQVSHALGLHWEECLRVLVETVGLLLLSAVFSSFSSSIRSEGVRSAFSFCSSLAILGGMTAGGYACFSAVAGYFSTLCDLTTAALPLIGGLYAMGGNVTAAAASAGGLTVYLAILENIVGRSILPFCGICLAFALMTSPMPGLKLGSLLSGLKKQYTTLLAFLMMLLLAMLASQTTLAARADTLAMRSAKFAAGSLIPVVGGSVAELLRTVSAGVGYLRGTVGICGVLLLIFSLLPTLIELLLYRLVWQISAGVAELLGCDGERRLLDEIASLCGYLIAAVSICSSVLLLALSLLVRCSSAIG